MKKWLVLGISIAALVGSSPILASSVRARLAPDPRIAKLQRQVAVLQRQMKLQVRLNANFISQISSLQDRRIEVSVVPGAAVSVAPRSWGYASSSCALGTAVAGGFQTDYPAEFGSSNMAGDLWHVAAFNPWTGVSLRLTPQVVCASLR